jgi:hypothetical protein
MMGQQLSETALHGDAVKVSTLLSRQDAPIQDTNREVVV